MVTCVVSFAAVSLVLIAVQFSCLFAYQAKKEKAAAVPGSAACPEAALMN